MLSTRSRRRFLSLCAAGGALALAGCQAPSSSDPVEEIVDMSTGLVWGKRIEVELARADPPTRTDVLRVLFDRSSGAVYGSYDPAYVDAAVDGASITVSPELHESLTADFGAVNYGIAAGPMDGPGDQLHTQARREAFNALPLAGRATVETFWVQRDENLRVLYARPTDTTLPENSLAEVDIDHLDLGEIRDGY